MTQNNPGVSILFACLAVLSCSPVSAATVTVTNINDSGPGSLRGAIASAVSGDTIAFSLPYPATIPLGSTLTIGTSLTISGPGSSNLAISGGGSVGVFSIGSCTSAGSVPCSGVTATISGVTIENGNAYYGGGGVYNSGTLSLSNSVFAGNSSNTANGGGAIYNYFGVVTVTNCTLSGNSATAAYADHSASGGGILNYYGTLTMSNSTLSGNSTAAPATDLGGGMANFLGTVVVTNSTFAGNSASYGGGILNLGALTIANSTVSGNSALNTGGIYNSGFGTLVIKNTIVANTSSGGNCSSTGGYFTSYGHNLSDDATCAFSGTGDLNSIPAGLDPSGVQDNGGPTRTIALLATSPAVDAIPVSPTNYCTEIDGVTPVATDQRGVARPQGFGCDIGPTSTRDFPHSPRSSTCTGGASH